MPVEEAEGTADSREPAQARTGSRCTAKMCDEKISHIYAFAFIRVSCVCTYQHAHYDKNLVVSCQYLFFVFYRMYIIMIIKDEWQR